MLIFFVDIHQRELIQEINYIHWKKLLKLSLLQTIGHYELLKIFMEKLLKIKFTLLKILELQRLTKIIENTQRDLNISLINECAILFNKMNISIFDVLKVLRIYKMEFFKFLSWFSRWSLYRCRPVLFDL